MTDWTYFATYQTGSTTRSLPASFTELYLTGTSQSGRTAAPVNFLVPQVIIPSASSIDQSLGLVNSTSHNGAFVMLQIWSSGLQCKFYLNGNEQSQYYDVYYR